jgi:L-fuconolactonase
MFGSDWPVCLLASTYKRWGDAVTEWAAPLSDDERHWLFCQTASQTYRLDKELE